MRAAAPGRLRRRRGREPLVQLSRELSETARRQAQGPAEARERLLLQNLHVEDCFFMDTTVLDRLTVQGWLPEGKDQMLSIIERLLALHFNPDGSRKKPDEQGQVSFKFLSPIGPSVNQ